MLILDTDTDADDDDAGDLINDIHVCDVDDLV